mmetsp:Transcript_25695/g.43661  ORF Transcript_25695/g.43661 Transcript_25695/m.43661 type:complete len:211 (-) Transcript_25695:198-830(-)
MGDLLGQDGCNALYQRLAAFQEQFENSVDLLAFLYPLGSWTWIIPTHHELLLHRGLGTIDQVGHFVVFALRDFFRDTSELFLTHSFHQGDLHMNGFPFPVTLGQITVQDLGIGFQLHCGGFQPNVRRDHLVPQLRHNPIPLAFLHVLYSPKGLDVAGQLVGALSDFFQCLGARLDGPLDFLQGRVIGTRDELAELQVRNIHVQLLHYFLL